MFVKSAESTIISPTKEVWLPWLLRIALAAVLALGAVAEVLAQPAGSRPRVIVYPNAVIKGAELTLDSIATISANHEAHEQLAAALRAVPLGPAPAPRMRRAIPGKKVLQKIEKAGISLDSFGYTIPHVVNIERSGRIIAPADVLSEAKRMFDERGDLDLQVREISWSHAQVIPLGDTRFRVQMLGAPNAGKVPLRITAMVDGTPEARFLATAIVDDWREVPVVNRTLDRGMLINADDVELVRLNLFSQPPDVEDRIGSVVGRRVRTRITAGSTIRRSMVDIPPVVAQGKRITMTFNQGGLTATASGIALEDGHEDSVIRVKNDASGRVVRATVIGPEEVEVQRR